MDLEKVGACIVGIFIIALVVSLFSTLLRQREADEAQAVRAAAYLVAHNCRVAGYAGKSATPFYRCDTGLIRAKDVP